MTRSSAWKRTAASGALCAFALILRGGTAYADDADAARAAMRRGLEALERHDATTALVEYETAKRLVPAANAPYYFAASALESLTEAVELALFEIIKIGLGGYVVGRSVEKGIKVWKER